VSGLPTHYRLDMSHKELEIPICEDYSLQQLYFVLLYYYSMAISNFTQRKSIEPISHLCVSEWKRLLDI